MNVQDIYFSVTDLREGVSDAVANREMHLTGELIDFTIDTTLGYVVEWLERRGDTDVADDLVCLMEE